MHIQRETTGEAVDAAVRRFEAASGAKVVSESVANDQYKQKIAVALPSDDPPDVFHTWGGGVLAASVADGLVAPLSADVPLDGILPQALEFCKVDGRPYAVPVDVSIVGFWYRKSILDEHGVRPPKTFAGLLEACARLRSRGVTPIALGNVAHWPGAFYFDYLMLRLGGTQQYLAESDAAGKPVRVPRARAARALIRALVDVEAFSKGFNGMDYNQSRAVFFQGNAAMTLMGSWLLSYAATERGDVVEDLGLFPFPAVGESDGALLGGVNAAYAVAAKSSNRTLAMKLLAFLSDEAAARDWAATGRIPARTVKMEGASAGLQTAVGLLKDAPRIQLYYDQALTPAVAEKHKAYTQSIFTTRRTRTWPRLLVGAVAVLILVFVALALRTLFASGE
jgi:raffinose/stachyose/melibiose transport system substrate-binding protein